MRQLTILMVAALALVPLAAPASADTTTSYEGTVGCSVSVRTPVTGISPDDRCSDSEIVRVSVPENTTRVVLHLEWDQVSAGVDDLAVGWSAFLPTVQGSSPLVAEFDGGLPAAGVDLFGTVRAADGSAALVTDFTLTLTFEQA